MSKYDKAFLILLSQYREKEGKKMKSVNSYFSSFYTEINKYSAGIHILNPGTSESLLSDFENKYNIKLPYYYREWLKINNGGELFAVPAGTILSQLLGDSYPIEGESYLESNFNMKARCGIPQEIFIIADTSYGDVIGFNLNNTDAYDGEIVCWSHESGSMSQTWNSFIEWLNYEMESGRMIIDYNGDDV